MRILAVSDLHVDYDENTAWVSGLSQRDYTRDILILGGDISHSLTLVEQTFDSLARRFAKVLYVPGNHDLWVARGEPDDTSFGKLERIRAVAEQHSISMDPHHAGRVSIVPLHAWYDYSFGAPSQELIQSWADYQACQWPDGASMRDVTDFFARMNEPALATRNDTIISFSHFLPRIDVMPAYISPANRVLYPVLGTTLLEQQIRQLQPALHLYGHSHVNRRVALDGICYVNNAFGYPCEVHITAKRLICVYDERGIVGTGDVELSRSARRSD